MKKNILSKIFIALFFAILIISCKKNNAETNNRPSDGIIITDRAERQVTIPKKISRIVSLMKECTSVVATLDAVDMLVGLDSDSMSYFIYQKAFLENKNIQNVGSTKEPNIELITTLKPDIILAWAGYGSELADQIQNKTGIPVIALHTLTTISGMEENYNIVGGLIHKEKRAKELFDYANQKMEMLSKVTSQIPESQRPNPHFSQIVY